MMENVVSVREIAKSYGNVRALTGISFDISKGEIFGLIGPDGAGKTTLFRILNTLILPDEGVATVDGLDTKKYVNAWDICRDVFLFIRI